MSKTTTMNVEIRFGDCDPAGIVFFPRYHRWMDASSLHFFMSCGVPPWHVLEHRPALSARRCSSTTRVSSRAPPTASA